MSVSLDRGTTIGRLRFVAATADPNALRMRGGTVLGTLDLQPPSMPEQAILCIRKLHDPLPGGLDLRSSAAPRPAAWEAAMRSAIAGAMRGAVRPALGPVPANADAVLFADRSELLACAARDGLRGALTIHWWWTHLLRGERSTAAVIREWARTPAYVPAAVELLAAKGEIAELARAVPAGESVRLIEAVLRAHALPALASDIVTALTASFATATTLMKEQPSASPAVAQPHATPPWRAIVPDLAPAMLTVEQQSFIAVALVLRRAPALARSEPFAREVVAWIEGARQLEGLRAMPAASRPIPLNAADSPHDSPTLGESRSDASPAAEHGTAEPPTAHSRWETAPETAPREAQLSNSPKIDDPLALDATPEAEVISTSANREASEPPLQDLTLDISVDSDFAGVFFLLNVGIALGLYSDFTSPVQCGISLDIWDFLALMGAEIADLEDDPIGPLLATLANRKDEEPPGADFVPPNDQSMSEWLDTTVERIRDRLALAGIEDPSRVIRRYGRITTTPAHLDVYFSLAAHPIEIRLAGLDRNPGWIPAAGRHVAFHFD
ncbi:MAG TPA: hypothetical protein VGS07_11365 [Thermoanaerobaculia bacterium]|jgi:hypothetical protein|nr:hypothetical protein [Thermoanaerobaculia bacterium]